MSQQQIEIIFQNGEKHILDKLSSLTKVCHSRNDLTFTIKYTGKGIQFSRNTLLNFIVGANAEIQYSFLTTIINSLPYNTALGFLSRAFAPLLWRYYLFYKPITPALYEITSYVEQVNSNPTMEFQKDIFILTYPDGSVRSFDLSNYANFVLLTDEIFYSTMPGDYEELEKVLQKLKICRKTQHPPYIIFAAAVLAYLGYLLCIDSNKPVLIFSYDTLRGQPFRKVFLADGKFVL